VNTTIHHLEAARTGRGEAAQSEGGIPKFAWFDMRALDGRSIPDNTVSLLLHLQFDGVIVDDRQLELIPDGLRKVLFVTGIPMSEQL
jgi:hypothetical protein